MSGGPDRGTGSSTDRRIGGPDRAAAPSPHSGRPDGKYGSGPGGAVPKLAVLGLLAVTASWGSTFFLIKDVVTRVPVPDFLAVRFAVAAVVGVFAAPTLARLGAAAWRRGAVLGLLYGLAQILQTEGLAHTSASVSGFVTGMYVVLTPVLAGVLLRHRIGRATWLAVALATAGLAVLALRGLAFGPGELLTLLSAGLYALHIVALGAWTNQRDAFGLSVVQLGVIAVVCGVAAAPGGITVPDRSGDWLALLYMALIAGAFALVTQTWAQAHLPPTRAAVIMCMEPVWASAFALVFGGESLTVRMVAGGGLILAAMYTAKLAPRRRLPAETPHLPV
ncbi:Permease of the drug/metabolite transporter (DMT) superfamily [Actinopolymorpha singaporensis]|uniref:Permease of the drug/metabolite transporter (DMT) superfamily n=1 Tax=Actinopolymorpha singaporensis TaxID=117157 RepID=A0A1H1X6P5_9ACTN|nr:Permease of the drug/metabolite transporter (DMT) superfamily [Actinopolymorpha singaporensis]